MRKLFICALLLIVALSSVACGGKTGTLPIPTPSPTANGEFTIPDNFTTYIDEDGLFNISYPQDWVIWQKSIPRIKVLVAEYMNNTNSGTSSENALENLSILFLAGLPTSSGTHDPSITIVVWPLSTDERNMSLEAFTDSATSGMRVTFDSYDEISRDFTVIDGREAVIIEYKLKYQETELHLLLIMTVIGNFRWTVGCGGTDANFNKYKNDFQIIVRSLQVNLARP